MKGQTQFMNVTEPKNQNPCTSEIEVKDLTALLSLKAYKENVLINK